jgi:hypothetical protein
MPTKSPSPVQAHLQELTRRTGRLSTHMQNSRGMIERLQARVDACCGPEGAVKNKMRRSRPVSHLDGDDIDLRGMMSSQPGRLVFDDKTGAFEWAGDKKVRRGKRYNKSKKRSKKRHSKKSRKRSKKRNSKKSRKRRR